MRVHCTSFFFINFVLPGLGITIKILMCFVPKLDFFSKYVSILLEARLQFFIFNFLNQETHFDLSFHQPYCIYDSTSKGSFFSQHLWNVTLVQLVSLMYREQQQSTIRKLIHEWLESSLSESSEDDENNTMSSSSSVSRLFLSHFM